jgi:hypothetical protein
MDDLIDLLIDLLIDQLEWVLPLLGKFWVLIAGFFGYLLFGKKGKQGRSMSQGKPQRPPLTPVDSGDFPLPADVELQPERRMVVRQESRSDMEERAAEPEWLEEELHMPLANVEAAPAAQVVGSDAALQPSPAEQATEKPTALDPREGMKWAIIFGPPRAKSRPLPYRRSV